MRQDRGPRGRARLPRLHPRFAGAHCRGHRPLQAGPRAAPGLRRREARRPGSRAHHRRAPEIRRRRPAAHAGLAAPRGASAGSGRAAEPSRGGPSRGGPSRGGDPSHDPARGTALKMRGTGFHARRRLCTRPLHALHVSKRGSRRLRAAAPENSLPPASARPAPLGPAQPGPSLTAPPRARPCVLFVRNSGPPWVQSSSRTSSESSGSSPAPPAGAAAGRRSGESGT